MTHDTFSHAFYIFIVIEIIVCIHARSLLEELEDIEAQTTTLSEEHINVETKVKRSEELYQHEKEMFDQTQLTHETEMRDIETRLMKVRDTTAEDNRIATASRKIIELQAARDSRQSAHRQMKRELMEAVMEAVTQCASHREFVQQQLSDTKSMVKSRLEAIILQEGIYGSGVKCSSKKIMNESKDVEQEQMPVESDQIYLEEGDLFEQRDASFTYDMAPSMGGVSPINDGAKEGFADTSALPSDMDSSTMSMVPGLASVNLSIVAKEQNLRNRLSVWGRPSEAKADFSHKFDNDRETEADISMVSSII